MFVDVKLHDVNVNSMWRVSSAAAACVGGVGDEEEGVGLGGGERGVSGGG